MKNVKSAIQINKNLLNYFKYLGVTLFTYFAFSTLLHILKCNIKLNLTYFSDLKKKKNWYAKFLYPDYLFFLGSLIHTFLDLFGI